MSAKASHWLKVRGITAESHRLIDSFQSKLRRLVKTKGLPPGMAIAIMTNLNFHGQDMPADVFNRLDYSLGFETPDDPIVLGEALKRISDGKVKIDRTTRVNIGDFVLQYNFVRGYRPKRGARKVNIPLDKAFNPKDFNYARKECDPEKFASRKYGRNLLVDFLFNRYPFAPYHFLWIPNRKTGRHNQYLSPVKDAAIIEAAWRFVAEDGLGEGIRLCYNSNGAHASVNHFHLQGFFLTDDWEPPIEHFIRNHDGSSGLLHCHFPGARWISKSDGVKGLKSFIAEMNRRYHKYKENIAYHFCIAPEGIACFPRKHQGDEKYFALLEKAPFTTGYAFFEMLGEIISPTADILSSGRHKMLKKQVKDLYRALSIE
ncbi:MAG: hypothetical protein WAK60_02180 [Sedimentisphaerales bacterium]